MTNRKKIYETIVDVKNEIFDMLERCDDVAETFLNDPALFWKKYCEMIDTKHRGSILYKAAMRTVMSVGTIWEPGTYACHFNMPATRDCMDAYKYIKRHVLDPFKVRVYEDTYLDGSPSNNYYCVISNR